MENFGKKSLRKQRTAALVASLLMLPGILMGTPAWGQKPRATP